ncbi:LysR family transcriptional regulator [Nocardia araoensis]|uniref:LysR family transcriptional regulator n=1 Tax=Nocardia araoensis TaxID=228600 RepID=UPI0009FDA1EB|nr:LysR family transcriptional regulator [Nocardia araoensis]
MLERYEIEAFLTLCEELHFGRTAERLRLTTTRVSQTIRKLERRIGAELFNRTSRRVEMTPIGRQLEQEIRPTWNTIIDAYSRTVQAGRGVTGVLRVAFIHAAGGVLLTSVIKKFRADQPSCAVHLREAQLAEAMPWLREGKVDIVLCSFPVREAGIVTGPPLINEPRLLAVSSRHQFARRNAVSTDELASITILRLPETMPESLREDRGSRIVSSRGADESEPASTFQDLLMLIGAGRGALPVGASAAEYYARPEIVYVPIVDAKPIEWGLIWRSDNATARVRAFCTTASEVSMNRISN